MTKKNTEKKYLFISVKPEFANKIISKDKTIELRKVKPKVKENDFVVIYASSPVQSVVAFGIIEEIILTSPQMMWDNYSQHLGIDETRFNEYYKEKKQAIGIRIKGINKLPKIHLKDLKKIDPNFHPPQVYRYISNTNIRKTILEYVKPLSNVLK